MAGLELVLLCLAVSAGLRIVAERLNVPYASVLVVGGLLLALIPGLPRVMLAPDVVFLVFIPPLLYSGAIGFPLRELRRQLGPIVRLSVVMVIVSTAAVAIVAHALHPSFTWAAAITLGAVISPPDPVAVLSVMRSLRMPRTIQSILEGEGLANDATALVIYRFAIAAAVTGVFSMQAAAVRFVVGALGGVAVGIVVGMLVTRLHRITRQVPVVSNTVSLLTPFASFLLADTIGVSGILSVLATGLYAARTVPKILGAQARVQVLGMWTVVTFMLESLIFILVGIQLPYVLNAADRLPLSTLLWEGALISLTVVVVRIVWVMPTAYLFRIAFRWLRRGTDPLPPWRQVFFIAWAGLRGGESLVFALAIPLTTATGARFPAREQIIFITFSVIFITLVLQGPTLGLMARWLRIGIDEDVAAEEAHARLAAAEQGLRVLSDPVFAGTRYPEVVRYLKQRHRQRARRWAAREQDEAAHRESGQETSGGVDTAEHEHFTIAPSHEAAAIDEQRGEEYRRVRAAMLEAEQQALLDLRDRGVIGDDVLRKIQRDLDLETLLLETSEPVIETVSEVPAAIDAASTSRPTS
ncbi:MAG TPA: Na+/H+ antiporter [Gemmatimonadaceae bacterium]